MPRDVIQFRTDTELTRMLDELALALGGPLSPASRSAVIREAVRRLHESEVNRNLGPGKKSKKSS